MYTFQQLPMLQCLQWQRVENSGEQKRCNVKEGKESKARVELIGFLPSEPRGCEGNAGTSSGPNMAALKQRVQAIERH